MVITGERAEESSSRSKYPVLEKHRTDNREGKNKRHVDHARIVHQWSTSQIWSIIEKYCVTPHPAYYLGFGRCSCRNCIFLNANDLKAVRTINPKSFHKIAKYETEFNKTIHYDSSRAKKELPQLDIIERSLLGNSRQLPLVWVNQANSINWYLPIIQDKWEAPKGMYASLSGGSPS